MNRHYWYSRLVLLAAIALFFLAACDAGSVGVESAPDSCFSAKIASPSGDRSPNGDQAEKYTLEARDIVVTWDKPDCAMIIQYYQGYKADYELDTGEVASPHTIHIAKSGKTEIKIWRKGFQRQSDAVWIWVK